MAKTKSNEEAPLVCVGCEAEEDDAIGARLATFDEESDVAICIECASAAFLSLLKESMEDLQELREDAAADPTEEDTQ